jgi:2TM domain
MSNSTEPMDREARTPPPNTDELRACAIKRLHDRRGLTAHALAYGSVNVLFVALWLSTGAGFFWPLFPICGWGIGLVFHAWSVFWPEPGEAQIDREIERIRRDAD